MKKQGSGAGDKYAKLRVSKRLQTWKRQLLLKSKEHGGITGIRTQIYEDKTVWVVSYKDGTTDSFSGAIPDVVFSAVLFKL